MIEDYCGKDLEYCSGKIVIKHCYSALLTRVCEKKALDFLSNWVKSQRGIESKGNFCEVKVEMHEVSWNLFVCDTANRLL